MALDKYAFSKIARGENPTAGAQEGSNKFNAREYLGGGADSGMSENFMSLRQRIADESDARRSAAEPPAGKKRADGRDYLAATMGKIGENIMGLAGAEEAAKTETKLDDVGSFLLGLPLGTISAPFTGASQLHEAASGHRATEMDDAGYIPSQDLDLGQRLATGASGVINAVGPFFGGSAGMLRGAKNAALMGGAKAAGLMGAEDTAKKMAGKAIESSAKSLAKEETKGWVGRLASEAAEEGLEEFVQSPLDEIRDGTLDDGWFNRAVEAGAMGALGGSIMSGAGMALDRTFGKMANPSNQSSNRMPPLSPDTKTIRERRGFSTDATSMVSDAKDSIRDTLAEQQKVPGAASALQVSSGLRNHGLDDGTVGSGLVEKIFYYPDRRDMETGEIQSSAKTIADWFGVTTDEMHRILSGPNKTAELNQLVQNMKANGQSTRLLVGRNPDTNRGLYWIDVDEIVDSDYIDLNPLTYSYVKSDIDGDKAQLYFDRNNQASLGYVSENIVAPEAMDQKTGQPAANVDISDYGFMPATIGDKSTAQLTKDDVRRIFTEAIDETVGTNSGIDAVSYADRWADEIASGKDSNKANFFNEINAAIKNYLDNGGQLLSGAHPGTAVSKIIGKMQADTSAGFSRAMDAAAADVRRANEIVRQMVDMIPGVLAESNEGRGMSSKGDLGGIRSYAEAATDMLNAAYAKYNKAATNVGFRQDGRFILEAQSKLLQSIDYTLRNLHTAMSQSGLGVSESVYQMLVDICVRQVERGGDVTTTISGLFDAALANGSMTRFRNEVGHTKIQNGEDLEVLKRVFRDEYAKLYKAYEKAILTDNTANENGMKLPGEMDKPQLLESDGDAALARYFKRAFGSQYGEDMVEGWPKHFEGKTWNEAVRIVSQDASCDRTQFVDLDNGFQQLFNMMLADEGRQSRQVAIRINSEVEASVRMFANLRSKWEANGKKLHGADFAMAEQLVTKVRSIIGQRSADKIGLVSVDSFFDSGWGEMLSSGNQELAMKAICEMAVSAKYDGVIAKLNQALKEKDGLMADKYRMAALNMLGDLVDTSRVDDYIISEIADAASSMDALKNAETFSRLYGAITSDDPRLTFGVISSTWDAGSGDNASVFLTDVLTTPGSTFSNADLSSRMNRAASSQRTADQINNEMNIERWNAVFKAATDAGQQERYASAIDDLLSDRTYEVGNDAIGSAVYAATTIANSYKEKGVVPRSSQIMYAISEISRHGALYAWSDKLFGLSQGRITKRQFLDNPTLIARLMVDPKFSITITDWESGQFNNFSRDDLIRDVIPDWNGGPITLNVYNKIFTKYPQLISIIAPPSMSVGVNENSESTVTKTTTDYVDRSLLNRVREVMDINEDADNITKRGSEARKRAMRRTKLLLMDHVEFIPELCRMMGDVDGRLTLSEATKRSSKLVDDMCNYFIDLAMSGEGTKYIDMLAESSADTFNSVMGTVNESFRAAMEIASLEGEVLDRANDTSLASRDAHIKHMSESIVSNTINKYAADKTAGLTSLFNKASKKFFDEMNGVDQMFDDYMHDLDELETIMSTVFDLYVDNSTTRAQIVDEINQGLDAQLKMIDDEMLVDTEGKTEAQIKAEADNVREAIKNELTVDNIDSQVTAISNSLPTAGGTLNPDDKLTGFITIDDFGNGTDGARSLVKEKISEISRSSNFNLGDGELSIDETMDKIDAICDEIVKNDGVLNEEIKNKIKTAMSFWNSVAMRDWMMDKNLRSGTIQNVNIFNAVDRHNKFILDMRDAIRSDMIDNGIDPNLVDLTGERPHYPHQNFSDPTLDLMANRAIVNSTRGGASTNVGLNGAKTRAYAGFDFIPRDYRSPVAPIALDYNELMNLVEQDRKSIDPDGKSTGYNRFIGAKTCVGGPWTPKPDQNDQWGWELGTFTERDLDDMKADPTKKVLIFDPIMSPNGIDINCTHDAYNGNGCDFQMTLAMIGRLLDGTQEGMALKTAKTIGNVNHMSQDELKIDGLDYGTDSTDMSALNKYKAGSPDWEKALVVLREKARDNLIGYRDKWRKNLNAVFSDDANKVLGMGNAEALHFSQLITPFVEAEVEILDASGNVVDTKIELIDSINLFATDDIRGFRDAIASMTSDGSRISRIIPVAVNPEEISMKIQREVAASIREGGKKNRQKIALDAATKWQSSYAKTLKIGDVLTDFSPVKPSSFEFAIGDDRTSPLGKFLDELYGSKALEIPGNSRSRMDYAAIRDTTINTAYSIMKDATTLGLSPRKFEVDNSLSYATSGRLSVNGMPLPVKAFCKDRDKLGSGVSGIDSVSKMFEPLKNTKENECQPPKAGNNPETAGIVFSDAEFLSALTWSMKYQQLLYVPEKYVSPGLVSPYPTVGDPVLIGGEKFNIIAPYKNDALRRASLRRGKAAVMDFDPANVAVSVAGGFTVTMGDGASYVNSETIGRRGLTLQNNHKKIDVLSDLLSDSKGSNRNVKSYSLCTIQDMAELASLTDENLKKSMVFGRQYSKTSGSDIDQTKAMIDIRDAVDYMANNGVSKRDSASRGDVLAFAKIEYLDGSVSYAPITLGTGAPSKMLKINVTQDGSAIKIDFDAIVSIKDESDREFALKYAIHSKSYKTMATVLDKFKMPMLGVRYTDESGKTVDALRADIIYNSTTDENRNSDAWLNIMKSNLMYWVHAKSGGSLLYKRVNDGNYEVNPWLEKCGLSPLEIKSLLEGTDIRVWRKIVNQKINLVDPATVPTDSTVNDVIRHVIANNIRDGIPNTYFFSAITKESLGGKTPKLRGKMFSFSSIDQLNRKQTLELFNAMDDKCCPPGLVHKFDENGKLADKKSVISTTFDEYGRMMQYIGRGDNGRPVYLAVDVSVGDAMTLGVGTTIDRVSASAAYSLQHSERQGLSRALTERELDAVTKDTMLQIGDYGAFNDQSLRGDESTMAREGIGASAYQSDIAAYVKAADRGSKPIMARDLHEFEARKRIAESGKMFTERLPIVLADDRKFFGSVDSIATVKENDPDYARKQSLHDSYTMVRDALGMGDGGKWLTWDRFMMLIKRDCGITYNDGKGTFQITVDQIHESALRIKRNIEKNGLPIVAANNNDGYSSRYSLPMLLPSEKSYFWQFENIRNENGGDFSKFEENILAEGDKAIELITRIPATQKSAGRGESVMSKKKRNALLAACDWMYTENGYATKSGRIYGDTYSSDMIRDSNAFFEALFDNESQQEWKELLMETTEEVANKLKDYRSLYNAKYTITTLDDSGRTIVKVKANDQATIDKILNFATTTSQMMGVMSPSVLFANYADKALSTNAMKLAMKIGRDYGIGSYATDVDVNQDLVKQFSRDPLVLRFWNAMRDAAIDGDEQLFLATVNDEADLTTWIETRGNRRNKISDMVFRGINGGNSFASVQIENFMNYFLALEAKDGHNYWFQPVNDSNGPTEMRIEQIMASDNAFRLFVDIFGGGVSFSLDNAMVAQNNALRGDMAQRSVPSMLYNDFVRQHGSAAKFFSTTFVSRFMQARINQGGRMLNWILPMSTLHHATIEFLTSEGMADTKIGQRAQLLHIEDARTFKNFKMALASDALHMAPAVLAAVLLAIPGAIEPPEDDDKWGNPTDWLFFGHRIYPDWELESIMGMALPAAAFWKSCSLGKPRIDLLTNGAASVFYNNPMARMSDLLAMITGDPESSILSDYERDVETYADAKNGSPDLSRWLMGQFQGSMLTWAGQFWCPQIFKELFSTSLEHSYNKVYEETSTGALTEAGANGKTMKTTYEDAMLRKVARRNPVTATLLDITLRPNTGYLESEMPLVVIPDQAQMDSQKYWSLYDDAGNPLPESVRQEKIIEIISLMQQTDDMEDLYKAGFYLDSKTRFDVGDTIWQICSNLTDAYYEMEANGDLNPYVLGGGDYYKGKALATQISNAYYDELDYWKSFYYDKLESEPMRRGMVMYNRYKTTYAQDDNGDVYATGIMADTSGLKSLSPVKIAPDSLTESTITMGYEGDFMTPSAVTGESTGMRALIPVEQGYENVIPFESHDPKNQPGSGDNGDNNSVGNKSKSNGNGSKSSGGRSYGNRKGGGGGGGGRGGSAPNLYSRLPKAYNPSPKTMYGERLYDTKYDYLRPGFETKGSREAYKRSDI